jgi:fumarate hydratase, class II
MPHHGSSTTSNTGASRTEQDSMGSVQVPLDALWGAQTERARQNFQLSGQRFPVLFIDSLAQLKAAAAEANLACQVLDSSRAAAIIAAVEQLTGGSDLMTHFPLDILQTGSGTSTNMNMNEVLALLASQTAQLSVHANDHVNASQSSNDVIPSTILISSARALQHQLVPALQHIQQVLTDKAQQLTAVVKTGRTHLMDAMPLTMAQELDCWRAQLAEVGQALAEQLPRLYQLPQGGTAIGTGVNAPTNFSQQFCNALSERLQMPFQPATNRFAGIAGQQTNHLVAGSLSALAASLLKIANDLRWMNSGPLAGLAEIELPALQPGSSIMPGKVNPVIAEAVAMLCIQVQGNCHSVAMAAQQGNFQLNVMLPLIGYLQLQSIELLTNGCYALADQAIAGFTVKHDTIAANVSRNPILVTALNAKIGYDKAAQIAKTAYQQQRPIAVVAAEMTDLTEAELAQLLDPKRLTE